MSNSATWRSARTTDIEAIVTLCRALYREDPGGIDPTPEQIRQTLATFERDPSRGRAVVLDVDHRTLGYALLVSFYSNELGGECCEVDEIYVDASVRNQGHGAVLFHQIANGDFGTYVATSLGTTPNNESARRLYTRLGFRVAGVTMVRLEKGPRL